MKPLHRIFDLAIFNLAAFRHWALCGLGLAVVASALIAPRSSFAQAPAQSQRQLLPEAFAGWQLSGEPKTVSDAAAADPVEAPLLHEYGFRKLESASYEQEGRHLQIKALQFNDATGALGAFLYYRQPRMAEESIGDSASSLNEHVLFYRANIVVDAIFDKLTAMSPAQLRELAAGLPIANGGDRNPPNLPNYLPRKIPHAEPIPNTTRYAEGPIGLQKIGAPISADLVDFAIGAEVVTSRYRAEPEEATLTLIEYPTPQIALQHQQRIDAAHHPANAQENPGGPALVNLEQIYTRRSGPLVIIVSGLITPNAAGSLLGSVNYDPQVSWNERWKTLDKRENLGYLVLNIFLLALLLGALALISGIGFGFGRVFLSRMFPGRVRTYAEANEVISLGLGGSLAGPISGGSPGDTSPSKQTT